MPPETDEDLFAEAMGRVQPLPEIDKITPDRRLPRGHQVAVRHRHRQPSGLMADGPAARRVEPWSLVADGISRERLKRLAAGDPSVACTFDLHGMTCDMALSALADGFARAVADDDVRVICIIHGRGLHSSDGKPVLKKAVYHWLTDGPFAGQVLAAIPRPGSGGGACLVLLRRTMA
ncbi:hypothetical protein FEF65_08470 [Mariprofundus erugo]|uniref:Smr domain-containing protein n=1 Tax=Mariprofundus erugo TaxID=2528639 RepID=A0A5R9GRD4_9PROT|nr:Smr/MutS family protein [Mariprofundus erugo]TLS66983.1 hypothetical protein FEF65_08470 [Mariprofundus erugo]